MPSSHSFYRPFLLISAVLCFFTAIQAQQFEPMRGGDGPMRGDDGGPRANNRGGIRITASGQCMQLQFDDKNLNTAGAAGAIISLWIPNDTASIGNKLSDPSNAERRRAIHSR